MLGVLVVYQVFLTNQNTHVIAFTPIAQNKKPGGNLLSHANAHYHRRNSVSRFCSGWEDVGPECYDHQAKLSAYYIKDYVCVPFASSLKK